MNLKNFWKKPIVWILSGVACVALVLGLCLGLLLPKKKSPNPNPQPQQTLTPEQIAFFDSIKNNGNGGGELLDSFEFEEVAGQKVTKVLWSNSSYVLAVVERDDGFVVSAGLEVFERTSEGLASKQGGDDILGSDYVVVFCDGEQCVLLVETGAEDDANAFDLVVLDLESKTIQRSVYGVAAAFANEDVLLFARDTSAEGDDLPTCKVFVERSGESQVVIDRVVGLGLVDKIFVVESLDNLAIFSIENNFEQFDFGVALYAQAENGDFVVGDAKWNEVGYCSLQQKGASCFYLNIVQYCEERQANVLLDEEAALWGKNQNYELFSNDMRVVKMSDQDHYFEYVYYEANGGYARKTIDVATQEQVDNVLYFDESGNKIMETSADFGVVRFAVGENLVVEQNGNAFLTDRFMNIICDLGELDQMKVCDHFLIVRKNARNSYLNFDGNEIVSSYDVVSLPIGNNVVLGEWYVLVDEEDEKTLQWDWYLFDIVNGEKKVLENSITEFNKYANKGLPFYATSDGTDIILHFDNNVKVVQNLVVEEQDDRLLVSYYCDGKNSNVIVKSTNGIIPNPNPFVDDIVEQSNEGYDIVETTKYVETLDEQYSYSITDASDKDRIQYFKIDGTSISRSNNEKTDITLKAYNVHKAEWGYVKRFKLSSMSYEYVYTQTKSENVERTYFYLSRAFSYYTFDHMDVFVKIKALESKTQKTLGTNDAYISFKAAKAKFYDNADFKLYFRLQQCTIKYYTQGGNNIDSKTAEYGTNYSLPTPTRSGYQFLYWYTASNSTHDPGAKYDAGANYTITSSQSLYAAWAPTITYYYGPPNCNESATYYGLQNEVIKLFSHSNLRVKNVNGTNYYFDGWYTQKVEGDYVGYADENYTLTEPVTLYAHYTIAPTVTFNLNANNMTGLSPTMTPMSMTIVPGKNYNQLRSMPTPSYDTSKYVFDGWYTAAVGGDKVGNTTIVTNTSNHTLYAHWKPKIKVTFQETGKQNQERIWTFQDGSTYVFSDINTANPYSLFGCKEQNDSAFDFAKGYNKQNEKIWVWKNLQFQYDSTNKKVTITNSGNTFTQYTEIVVNLSYVKLMFNSNGGSVSPAAQNVVPHTPVTLPSPGTKSGYVFDGWYIDSSFSDPKCESGKVAFNAGTWTLYARWLSSCSVTYDSKGGSVNPAAQNVAYGTSIKLPSPGTKTGYTFDGWYTNSSFTGTKYAADDYFDVKGNVTFYAKWKAITYQVSVDKKDGTSVTTRTINHGSSFGLPSVERLGYKFDGWYTNENYTGTKYNEGSSYTITSNVNFYAKWNDISISITFNANGGWFGDQSTTTEITLTGNAGAFEMPTASHASYSTVRWQLRENENIKCNVGQVNIAEAMGRQVADNESFVFDAVWSSPTNFIFTNIEFVIDPDDADKADLPVIAENNRVVLRILSNPLYQEDNVVKSFPQPIPKNNGYNFVGWFYTDSDGVEHRIDGKDVNSGDDLYYKGPDLSSDELLEFVAKFEPKTYAVTFSAGYGVWPDGGSGYKTIKETYGEPYVLPGSPVRAGYKFVGWRTISGVWIGTHVSNETTSATVWHAQFEECKYPIAFDTDGGVLSRSVVSPYVIYTGTFVSTYNEGRSTTMPTATKLGYTFAGWFYTDALGVEYRVDAAIGGQYYKVPALEDGTTITLVAHWTANTYSVDFDTDFADVAAPSAIEVTFESAYGNLPLPTKVGYRFDNWMLDGEIVGSTTIVRTARNHTLVAHWTQVDIEVTLDAGTGTLQTASTISAHLGKSYGFECPNGQLPTPTAPGGYHFVGWYTNYGELVESNTEVETAADHTLFARYKENTYSVVFDANHGTIVGPENASVTFGGTFEGTFSLSGKPAQLPQPNPRQGCEFDCWTYKGKSIKDMKVPALANGQTITLVASWKIAVVLDANWNNDKIGNKPFENIEFELDKTTNYAISAHGAIATQQGVYDFVEWNTKANGTGTTILVSTDLNASDVEFERENSAIKLYAKWKLHTYKITLIDSPEEAEYDFALEFTAADAPIDIVGATYTKNGTDCKFFGLKDSNNNFVTQIPTGEESHDWSLTPVFGEYSFKINYVFKNTDYSSLGYTRFLNEHDGKFVLETAKQNNFVAGTSIKLAELLTQSKAVDNKNYYGIEVNGKRFGVATIEIENAIGKNTYANVPSGTIKTNSDIVVTITLSERVVVAFDANQGKMPNNGNFGEEGGKLLVEVNAGTSFESLVVPTTTRDNFVFGYWKAGTTKYTDSTLITKDVTLVANWLAQITYNFVNQDGSALDIDSEVQLEELGTRADDLAIWQIWSKTEPITKQINSKYDHKNDMFNIYKIDGKFYRVEGVDEAFVATENQTINFVLVERVYVKLVVDGDCYQSSFENNLSKTALAENNCLQTGFSDENGQKIYTFECDMGGYFPWVIGPSKDDGVFVGWDNTGADDVENPTWQSGNLQIEQGMNTTFRAIFSSEMHAIRLFYFEDGEYKQFGADILSAGTFTIANFDAIPQITIDGAVLQGTMVYLAQSATAVGDLLNDVTAPGVEDEIEVLEADLAQGNVYIYVVYKAI